MANLLGGAPSSLARIGGGRNSQVFRLESQTGEIYALKAYSRHPGDLRDRLGVEFRALGFLWEYGVRCVPRPLAQDPQHALGLYEFIPGERPRVPSNKELDEASAFLLELKRLGSSAGARALPDASEACFSLLALAENIQTRFDRLAEVDSALADRSGLGAFLEDTLRPAWKALLNGCRETCRGAGVSFEAVLPNRQRTLSPSDFGFHNALRTNRGLVFLDFEYFGWDDPAKMLADFLLHPGLDLNLDQRQRFANGLLEKWLVNGLPERTRLVFPLYGIKWCLILLNEFLPGPLARRAFADPSTESDTERQSRQLQKARQKLTQILDDHAHFPYFSY